MVAAKEQDMGRFSVEVELANDEDLVRAKHGLISPQQVRHWKVRGVVDSGAARLVIPEFVAKQLGVETSGSVKVRYADAESENTPLLNACA